MRLAKKRLLIISTVFALLLNNTLPFVKVSADEYLEPQIESNIQMEELNELETTIDPVDTSEIPDEKTESEKPPIIDQAEENEEVPEETETTEGAGTTHEEHVTDEEETSTANDPTTNDDKATSIEDSITDKEATEENESNKEDTFELTIMHTNDTHGALDNMPKTVTAVKDIRAKDPNALLLHAGDVFTGTLYFNEFHGQADLAFMNLMQFDVMTFGNHEFDLGSSPEGHKALADFIIGAEFPFVSANVDFSKDATFGGLFNDYITADFQNGQIYDGIIKEINGEKVGIFGLTTEETVAISSPGSITFQNYLEEAEKAVNYFESQGINKIIALTHIGYDDNAAVDNDLILAERVEGIDIIVGGHSHTALQEPVKIENDETPTIIVQAGNANNNLGVLDVVFDEDGVIIDHSGELISIGTQEEDPEAVTLLAQYKERVDEVAQEEIGVVSPIELENPRTGGDNTKPSVRKNETILGNLITDGMLAKAREFTGENVVMALQNGGGIRAAIDAGPITVGEVITVLPFGNTLAIIDITGAELKEAFEISFKDYPGEFGGFLHVSGGMVEFDSTKPPGERVVGIYIKEDNGILVAVEDETMYTIATNAFTAKGGDGYTVFAKAYEEGRVTDLGLSDWENFRDHLSSIGSEGIPTEIEGRIVDVEGLFDLTIMHTNDTHARVEQFPYLSTVVKQIRSEKPKNLLVHSGDVFSGTLYFTVHQGLADLYFMNEIGFDVMTFGNHEFDKDSQTLANFVKDAQFPFVSANIDFSGDYELRTLAINEIGQPGEGGNIYPAIIKDFNGEKVGIFGLTTEETPIIASPSKAIKFNDAVKAAEETVKLLKDNGINKIIALSHLGYGADQQLAKKVDGIDVIVGGHSHTLLPEGLMIEKDEPTVIVQAGENLNNLGELNVSFDENGVIEDFSAEVHPLNDVTADPGLKEKVEEFKEGIDDLMKEVVGETTVHLDGERENVRTKETNLGNLIADGMVWKMQEFIPQTTIALQNGGGIRASIDEGEITMGEVRTVLPFDNTLVAIKLTGEELLQALEHSVSQYPEQSGGFLQVSGIKFKFDPEKEPYNRVWYVEVMSPDGEYVPLDLEEYYTVATNSFTAQGGDGYDSLKQAYEDGRMINIDIPDYEVFSEYLKEFSPVSPEVEGRIIAASKEERKEPVSDNGEEPRDEQKPSEEDKGQDKKDGKVLPNTATHHGNTLVAGFLLIVASIVIYLYIRKRKIHS